MKDNQSEHNMGEQIMGALSDALQSGDFNDLNRLVSQSVVNALNEVGKHISFDITGSREQTERQAQNDRQNSAQEHRQEQNDWQAREQEHRQTQNGWQTNTQEHQQAQNGWQTSTQEHRQAQNGWRTSGQETRQTQNGRQTREQERRQEQLRRQARQQERRQEQLRRQEQARQNAQMARRQANPYQSTQAVQAGAQMTGALIPYQFKRVGSVSNVLYQVFGGIGLGFTALATFFHITYTIMENSVSMAGWIVNLLALLFFTGMIRLGIGQRRRLKLAERYAGLCGRNLYGEIEHLARNTGRKARRVIKDLQKMMKLGMFPEGHLDEKKTCFMLNDSIYQQYLETENNRRLREAEAGRPALRQTDAGDPDMAAGQSTGNAERDAELNAIVAEGMECIRRLRLLNDKITGEVISAKLFRLENLLKNLFDSVREHPEQMHRMHKLMSYYLPTTLKLVEAYEEFDRVSAPGDDIIAAKAEIENTLDTINQAFTELLNNLFQDAVLDATTDAQVLKTMLAREGLMNQMDFTAAGSDSGF